MGQVEYADVYKFSTSLGIALIVLAFLLPWQMNQNQAMLTIEQQQIGKLTPIAQTVIVRQQQFIAVEDRVIPYFSIFLALAGLVLLVVGITRWIRRQTVANQIQDEELRAKRIQNMSAEEKKQSLELEITETDGISTSAPEIEVDEYLAVENRIYTIIANADRRHFQLFHNVKIGPKRYDIILRSDSLTHYIDKIIEVKYFKQEISPQIIKDVVSQFYENCAHYDEVLHRASAHYLIIVYTLQEQKQHIINIKESVDRRARELGFLVKSVFIFIDDLDTISVDDLKLLM